jgi:hypothetical protein
MATPKLSDFEDELAVLRKMFPTADLSLAITDHEEDDDGKELPKKIMLIINAQLHGAREVTKGTLSIAAHDLITELLTGGN